MQQKAKTPRLSTPQFQSLGVFAFCWYLELFTVLPSEKDLLFAEQPKCHCQQLFLALVSRPRKMHLKIDPCQCLWHLSRLFPSAEIVDDFQLPVYTAFIWIPKKRSSGRSWGTFDGLVVFRTYCTVSSWKSSKVGPGLSIFSWAGKAAGTSSLDSWSITVAFLR